MNTNAPEWLEGIIPSYFFQVQIMDLGLWQWTGLLLLLLLASSVSWLASHWIVRAAGKVVRRTRTTLDDAVLSALAGPLRLGLGVLLFFVGVHFLGLGEEILGRILTGCQIVAVVAATWLVLRLTDALARFAEDALGVRDAAAAKTLVPMGRRVTKAFILVMAALSLLQNLGFNVAGLLAGLGVGGLALALAAQKTVENLFGGVVVIADRPVKVGDFCRIGEHTGTVEDVGLRSTRIRTLDRTLLCVPNAEFSTVRIENYAARDRIRLHATVGVGYETTPEQMRYLLVEIRKVLYAHPRILPDPCRARFVNFGAYSLDVEVFAYADTKDWNEFLGIREDIYLRIMDVVDASGTYFAYPSQTLYLGKDSGRDEEKSRKAEEMVAGWREKNELFLPTFPEDAIRTLDDTLDFPPKGSPVGASSP